MTKINWLKPALSGAVIGAIAISIVGFNWGGWVSSGTANKAAKAFADEKVVQAMVPFCLQRAETDPKRQSKLAGLQETKGYTRRNAMMDTGWATMPGSEKPDRRLADACIEKLNIDGS